MFLLQNTVNWNGRRHILICKHSWSGGGVRVQLLLREFSLWISSIIICLVFKISLHCKVKSILSSVERRGGSREWKPSSASCRRVNTERWQEKVIGKTRTMKWKIEQKSCHCDVEFLFERQDTNSKIKKQTKGKKGGAQSWEKKIII